VPHYRNAVLSYRPLEWSAGQVPAFAVTQPEADTAPGGRASGIAATRRPQASAVELVNSLQKRLVPLNGGLRR
jgi:hypothetical protein